MATATGIGRFLGVLGALAVSIAVCAGVVALPGVLVERTSQMAAAVPIIVSQPAPETPALLAPVPSPAPAIGPVPKAETVGVQKGTTQRTVIVDPPPPPPSKAPELAPDPPILKILVDGDGTPTITVQGRPAHLGAWKLMGLTAGTWPVQIQSIRSSEARTFTLTLVVKDATDWVVSVSDPLGRAGAPVEVAPDAVAEIRWAQDGTIKVEKVPSSDP